MTRNRPSIPRRDDPGNYTFFLDFEGDAAENSIRKVLAEVESFSVGYQLLGCYPRAVEAD